MTAIVLFLLIFVPVWIVVQVGSFLFGFAQGIWWGMTVPDDRDLMRKIFQPSDFSSTGLALIIAGGIWLLIG